MRNPAMENVQTSGVQTSQAVRRNFLRGVRDALDLLLRDVELMEKGFKFSYIVDFAAIYAYLYRKSDHLFIQIPGESEDKTFARLQMALHILFTSRSHRLLLIPPYQEELSSHLRMLETNAALANAGIKGFFLEPERRSPYKDRLSRLISESTAFQDYIQLRNKQLKQEEVDEKLQRAAVEIAKDFFPELYTTIALVESTGNRENLEMLLRDRILLNSDEEIPECQEIDYSGERTDEWYKKIIRMRGGARAVQSYTDAMACTYVETANRILNPKKQIVVFVAPSRSVETCLRECKMICADDANPGVVRDLTYCLLSLIQKNDKARISGNLQMVKRLLEVYESVIPVEWRSKGEHAAREWNRCENLLLLTDSSMTVVFPEEGMSNSDRIFLDLLYRLQQVAGNKEIITQQIEETLSGLHRETIELNMLVPTSHTIETLRNIKVNSKGRGVQLVFPALLGELPFPISFTDRNVRALARNVGELKEDSSPGSVMSLRTLVLEAANKPDAAPEHHLLAGYILALEGRYETALADLEAGLINASGAERLELLFLTAAIHRKLYHAKEACEALEEALAIDKDDLRLNIEYAKALWLKWREQADRHANIQYLDSALKHLSRASKNVTTDVNKVKQARIENVSAYVHKVLLAQIENVSAYIYTEQAMNSALRRADNFKQAEAHIDTLGKLLPEEDWIGRFFDTRGYLRYAKANSLGPASWPEKKALLESAARDVAKSLEIDEAAGPDLEVRREHQCEINQALSELGGYVLSH
jgi:hypothetical protein